MARRRPITPQQLAEIREAAKRGPDGKPLEELGARHDRGDGDGLHGAAVAHRSTFLSAPSSSMG